MINVYDQIVINDKISLLYDRCVCLQIHKRFLQLFPNSLNAREWERFCLNVKRLSFFKIDFIALLAKKLFTLREGCAHKKSKEYIVYTFLQAFKRLGVVKIVEKLNAIKYSFFKEKLVISVFNFGDGMLLMNTSGNY